jgi:hypothetical protein
MSDESDVKDLSPGQAPGTGPAAAAYLPPAIAWEEPLEAIAATSCVLIPLECPGATTAS